MELNKQIFENTTKSKYAKKNTNGKIKKQKDAFIVMILVVCEQTNVEKKDSIVKVFWSTMYPMENEYFFQKLHLYFR